MDPFLMMQIFGAAGNAVGSFYEAKSAKHRLKSQALEQEFQASMSSINARQAEVQAQQVLEASQREIGRYTMQAGAAKASQQATMAARGLQSGVGSVAEIDASADIIRDIDTMTININAVREANAARMQAQNYRTQAAMQSLSAGNLRSSARTINAGAAAATSLMGSAAQVGSQWAPMLARGSGAEYTRRRAIQRTSIQAFGAY